MLAILGSDVLQEVLGQILRQYVLEAVALDFVIFVTLAFN